MGMRIVNVDAKIPTEAYRTNSFIGVDGTLVDQRIKGVCVGVARTGQVHSYYCS